MNYDNFSNEELLREVYLSQHTDRLLTLVCERLEMEMRKQEEIIQLESELADQDEELETLRKQVGELESRINFLTEDDPEF
jgi:septal ring factor EnvC (AmiA/AmiB activator)